MSRAVQVLAADPELAAALSAGERERAVRALVAHEHRSPPGPWRFAWTGDTTALLGLLVVEGIVAGTTDIEGRAHTEIVGAGDLLQPWTTNGEDQVVVSSLSWRVLSPLRALVLDRRFALAAAPWPELTAVLMNRLVLRARRLSFQMAASSLPRAPDRVLLMLWHFAERWGRVTREGVVVELPVTHTLFASVVGLRRPAFTSAVGELRELGLLATPGRTAWVLRPPAPTSFEDLREQVGLAPARHAADDEAPVARLTSS